LKEGKSTMKTFQDYMDYYIPRVEGLASPQKEDVITLLTAMEDRSGDQLFVNDLSQILKDSSSIAMPDDFNAIQVRTLQAMVILVGWGQPILSTGFKVRDSGGNMHEVKQPFAQEILDGKMPYTLSTGEVIENFPKNAFLTLTVADFPNKPQAQQTSQMRP
jgi:hypothetical protein